MAEQPGAYQDTNFAYQGTGEFAYQDVVFFNPPPIPKYTLMAREDGWIGYVLNPDFTP